MALYDLLAKLCGVPFSALLGGAATSEIALMPCMFHLDPAKAQAKAAEYTAEGYKYLKTKH